MNNFLKREFLLFFNIPKNIYLPLSIYSILFVIFIALGLPDNFKFANVFISSFITVFIISESSYKDDFESGAIEQMILEDKNLISYVLSKLFIQTVFVFIPMLIIGLLFSGLPQNLSLTQFSASYLACLLTLSPFFNLGSIVSIRKNNSLNALIIIPFLVPFIFLIEGLFISGQWNPNFYFLMAYFVFSIVFINLLVVEVIKIQIR